MISESRLRQRIWRAVKSTTRRISSRTRRHASSLPALRRIGNRVYHPWFNGFASNGIVVPEVLSGRLFDQPSRSLDLSAPILFLARGHSGTTPLAKILSKAGVHIGNTQDQNALNQTLDALYWVFGFQRALVPRLFKPGVGCSVNDRIVAAVAFECLRRHLGPYPSGLWGFKTCAGMFCHSLYQYVFPRAKYIYLVRDGRDVVLSDDGYFHLTHPFSRQSHWEYFKILTFGISDDVKSCPFPFPAKPHKNDKVMQHRFWVQAKSWREHVCMVEHLRNAGRLSPDVYTIRYEELCSDPVPVLEQLFSFLDIKLTAEVIEFAGQTLHTKSVDRWKQYKKYVTECDEDMDAVFGSMEPELDLLGYTLGV